RKWSPSGLCSRLHTSSHAGNAALGLTDPRLCYVLDGLLFIYAIIITALFPTTDFSNADSALLFQKLSHARRDEYDVLGTKRGGDPELGGKNQVTSPRSLQKDKMGEAYSEIGKKGEVSGTCHPRAGGMLLRTFHPIQHMCLIQPLLSVHSYARHVLNIQNPHAQLQLSFSNSTHPASFQTMNNKCNLKDTVSTKGQVGHLVSSLQPQKEELPHC
uniref:CD247 molecule n=1 Tax=Crocodylus porosus TaxID=8502 RepID=A0A7M4EXE5_CROPO